MDSRSVLCMNRAVMCITSASLWITLDRPVECPLSRSMFPVEPAPFQRFARHCSHGDTRTSYPQDAALMWTTLAFHLCTERFYVKLDLDVHRVMHSSGKSRRVGIDPEQEKPFSPAATPVDPNL